MLSDGPPFFAYCDKLKFPFLFSRRLFRFTDLKSPFSLIFDTQVYLDIFGF